MYKSLGEFIDRLEKEGELLRIESPVSSIGEIAEITDRQAKSDGGGKALLFTATDKAFPVLTNMMGSERRIAMALGVESLDTLSMRIRTLVATLTSPKEGIGDKLRMLPLLGEVSKWFPRKSSRRGACQQIVLTGDDASLDILPTLKCWPCDGGRFITLPMVNTIDPDTHIRNVGMYRIQIFDSHHCGMHWHRHKTAARHYEAYKAKGERMPVSIAIGGDPVYTYAATAPMPDNMDEYLLAGFLRKKPVTLVKSITNDIYIPADCDFVIEGYVDTAEPLRTEGDFGDHTGFYSLKDLYPQLHVTAITHRRNAVYGATIVGVPPQEDAYISQATERIFLEPIRLVMQPEVDDLYMPVCGTSHNVAILALKTRYAGQATKVAQGMWGAGQMMFNKYMVLLPQGVDIRDTRQLAWAARNLSTRNIYLSEGIYDVLDHATATNGYGGKAAFDCTAIPKAENTDFDNVKRLTAIDLSLPSELSFSSEWLNEWGVLLLFAETTTNVDFGAIIDQIDHVKECRYVALFDTKAKILNGEELLWLATANSDPRRDLHIIGERLCIDARAKIKTERDAENDTAQYPSRWPNVVCSSEETISLVDRRWAEYGIGPFIESPSLRYRQLLYSDSAEV